MTSRTREELFVYDLYTLVIAAGICSVAGLIVGWLISSQKDDHHDSTDYQQQINDLNEQNKQYQEEVTAHFAKTAALLNQLTSTYRDVHNHLADGAQELASDDKEVLRKLTNPNQTILAESKISERITPPLDYAPKKDDEKGILSEGYGFDNISS